MPGVASRVMRPLRVVAAAGLIGGTTPTKGVVKRCRRAGRTSVEAVLQAMTTRSGRCAAMSWPITSRTRATRSASERRP